MAGPEVPYSPDSRQARIIGTARRFTAMQYPLNSFGLTVALVDMQNQHSATLLPAPRDEIVQLVRSRDLIIKNTALDSMEAVATGQYSGALQRANLLHGYAEVDLADSLGGEAFNFSLNAHRLLFGQVVLNPDVVERLSPETRATLEEAKEAAFLDDRAREYDLVRSAVHTLVLDGVFGEEAKDHWDPYALIEVDQFRKNL